MKKWKLLVLYSSFVASGFLGGVFFAREKPELVVPDVMSALDQATKEVQRGCPLLYDYAIMLEQENARLNRTMQIMVFEEK